MGAVGGEADEFAIDEAGGVDDDIVEMLAADLMIHDHDVARLEAIEAPALDAILDGDAKIGEEDRQAAAILRDHAAFGVDETAAKVADLVDHHIVGGFAQCIAHFIGVSDYGIANDFDGDRMRIDILGHDAQASLPARSTMRWPASVTVTLSPG